MEQVSIEELLKQNVNCKKNYYRELKMEITKEHLVIMQEWLNNQSKLIAKETIIEEKSKLNRQYVGVLKFIEHVGGQAQYFAKHNHKIKLDKIPNNITNQNLSQDEYLGVINFLSSAGIKVRINPGVKAYEENI